MNNNFPIGERQFVQLEDGYIMIGLYPRVDVFTKERSTVVVIQKTHNNSLENPIEINHKDIVKFTKKLVEMFSIKIGE